jgi:hypothetical protein
MPNGKFKVMRQASFGAAPALAANNLTEKEARDYVKMQQENNDGALYTVEKEAYTVEREA